MVTPKQISPATAFGRSLLNVADAQALQTAIGSPASGARVTRSSAFSVPNNTATAIAFTASRWNQGGAFSLAQPTRLTAPVAGVYQIGAKADFDPTNTTGARTLFIRRNGITTLTGVSFPASVCISIETHTVAYLDANDYVEAIALQNSGVSVNVQNLAEYTPEFWMQKIDGVVATAAAPAPVRYTFSNANYTIPANADVVAQVGVMTGNRVADLPSAASVSAGKVITLRQEGQSYGGGWELDASAGVNERIEGGDIGFGIGSSIAMPFAARELRVVRLSSSAPYEWGLLGSAVNTSDIFCDIAFNSLSTGTNAVVLPQLGLNNLGSGANVTYRGSGANAAQATTGGTVTGRAGLRTGPLFYPGWGEIVLQSMVAPAAQALSDATNAYYFLYGLSEDVAADFGGSNSIGFYYTHSLNSGQWVCYCRRGGAETIVNTDVAVTQGGTPRLHIWVSPLASEVRFFINNQQAAVITTNIPQVELANEIRINKTVGTVGRFAQIYTVKYVQRS